MNSSDVASDPDSSTPIVLRIVVYGAVGLILFLPLAYFLLLLWGLQGPFWLYPFDAPSAAIQLGLTLVCALVLLIVGRLLLKVNERDWWLGGLIAAPWVAIAAACGVGYVDKADWSWLLGAGLSIAMASCAMAGPIAVPFLDEAWRRAGFSRLSLGRYLFWSALGIVLAMLTYCGGNR